jgi:hypothetical protein
MEQACRDDAVPITKQSGHEWARLIRKLHWIGLEEEARRLQLAVSTLPSDQRGAVLVGPLSTD